MTARAYFRHGEWGYSSDSWGITFDTVEELTDLANVFLLLPDDQYAKVKQLHESIEDVLDKTRTAW